MFQVQELKRIKQQMEEAVMGGVLLEGSMLHGPHILKTENFGVYDGISYQTIWAVMLEMHPAEQLDLLTLSSKLTHKGYSNLMWHVTQFTSRVASAANVSAHAMHVLQLDIEIKFLTKIDNVCIDQNNGLTEGQRLELHEVPKEMYHNEVPVFDVIPAVVKMMKQYHYPEEVIAEFNDVNEMLDTRIEDVLKQNKVIAVFREIERLHKGEFEQNTINALKLVYEITRALKIKKHTTQQTLETLSNALDLCRF